MHACTGVMFVAVCEFAKAGVIDFMKGPALEVASLGIYVNCAAPGVGETDLTRRQR